MRRLLAIMGEGGNGVEYARFLQPFDYLEPFGYQLVTLGDRLTLERGPQGYRPADALFDGIDGVMFPQMVASPLLPDGTQVDLVGSFCRRATELGLPIIYSVDDWAAEVERHNPAFETIERSIGNLEVILDHAAAAFVTTPTLREKLAPRGIPVHVLPNAVDPTRWNCRSRASPVPRIGWAGSSSHLLDLQMILPAIAQAQKNVDFEFFVFGIVDQPLRDEARQARGLLSGLSGPQRYRAEQFLELVSSLETVRYAHTPFVPLDSYFNVLSGLDLDIGICPLLESEFNRHKSALKFYEYAMCDTVTVASDVESYRDEVSMTVANTPGDWADVLEALLANPRESQRELDEQREYVLTQRTIQTICHDWAAALDATFGVVRQEQPVLAGAEKREK